MNIDSCGLEFMAVCVQRGEGAGDAGKESYLFDENGGK
jgi:hypothetical protein